MSVRYIGTRLLKHGTAIIRQITQRNVYNINIAEKINAAPIPAAPNKAFNNQLVPKSFALRNVGVQIGLQARRILIDNVLNRVTNSLAADLRKRAARRYVYFSVTLLIVNEIFFQNFVWGFWTIFCLSGR